MPHFGSSPKVRFGLEFLCVIPSKIGSILLLGSLVLAGSPLSAQTRKLTKKDLPPSAFKLISVKVSGTQRYNKDEIVAITGLQMGQTVDEDDFKHTAQLLGETGAFSNVLYSFQYSPDGTKLELQLTDADHFVPARFDNFVWFTDQELSQKLRQRVPLFKGELPASGNLADMVSDALQAMLIEAGVPGRADYLRSAKEGGPVDAIVFSVTGVDIEISKFSFAGAGANELPRLQAALRGLPGQEYRRSLLRAQADKDLLPVYLAEGYLKASIGDPEAKVSGHEDQQVQVDVTFPITPGEQYKLAKVNWEGNTVFPVEKLEPLLHLPTGVPFNAIELSHNLEDVQALYGTQGYMAAQIQPQPQFDDSAATVTYQMQVHEGEQYHMGDLDITGLDSKTMYQLVDRWKLQGGSVYDSSYPKRFLRDSVNEVLTAEEWSIAIHETIDYKDKTVDVSLRFDPRKSR